MEKRIPPPRTLELAMLAAGPVIWSTHFLLSYVTAAIWCAKYVPEAGPLGVVRTAVFAYTALALAGIGAAAWWGYRRHGAYGPATVPHDFDSPEDRTRFLGFATLLLALLSAAATVYVAAAAVFIEDCR